MANKTAKPSKPSSGALAVALPKDAINQHLAGHHQGWFGWFAVKTAHITGKPITFLTAVGIVVIWALTGPIFNYSDTWQLVINTGTTIITFLMVFLIQNTQNRDTMALQVKLAELIITTRGAKNAMATVEDLDEKELESLHKDYCRRAEETLDHLKKRKSKKA